MERRGNKGQSDGGRIEDSDTLGTQTGEFEA